MSIIVVCYYPEAETYHQKFPIYLQIADALEANKTVISLDLSSNVISDEGVQQLVKSISSGAAPDLIELNLEGNNITEKGKTALESLKKTRKLLKVKFQMFWIFCVSLNIFYVYLRLTSSRVRMEIF